MAEPILIWGAGAIGGTVEAGEAVQSDALIFELARPQSSQLGTFGSMSDRQAQE